MESKGKQKDIERNLKGLKKTSKRNQEDINWIQKESKKNQKELKRNLKRIKRN